MRRLVKILGAVFMGVALIMAGALPGLLAGEDRARQDRNPRQSGEIDSIRAKSRDRLKAGAPCPDLCAPGGELLCYVVHRDQKTVTLLEHGGTATREFHPGSPLGAGILCRWTAKTPVETFTVICSPEMK